MKALLLAIVLLVPALSQAATLKVKISLALGGDYIELEKSEIEADGWTEVEADDETRYVMEITLDESQLPLNKSLGPASVSISKEGLVHAGVSVGDADASAEGEVTLPRQNDKLAVYPGEITLSANGGDHASGSWYFVGTVSVRVQE